MKENSDTLEFIKDHISNYASPLTDHNIVAGTIRSPLVETVFLDTIEQLTSDIAYIKGILSTTSHSERMTGGNPIDMGIEYLNSNSSARGLESSPTNVAESSAPHPIRTEPATYSDSSVGGNSVGMDSMLSALHSSADGPESDPTYTIISHTPQTNTPSISHLGTIESHALSALSRLDALNNSSIAEHEVDPTISPSSSHYINTPTDPSTNINRELYLSKLDNRVSEKNVLDFMLRCGNFDSKGLNVIRLTKKNQDICRLSFVSFKIETTESYAQRLLEPGFWPLNCTIKEFVRKKSSNSISTNTLIHAAPSELTDQSHFLSHPKAQHTKT